MLPVPGTPIADESEAGPSVPIPTTRTRAITKRKAKGKGKIGEITSVEPVNLEEGDDLLTAKKQKVGSEDA